MRNSFHGLHALSLMLPNHNTKYLAGGLYPPQFHAQLGYTDQAFRQIVL